MENANKNSIYQLNEDYYNESEYKVNELIEEARILLEKKDFKQAEFYLNLAKLEPRMDLNNKIKCFGMTSIIRQSYNDETNLIEFILKIFKYLKEKSIKLMDVPTAYFIIRIFYRAGIIMHLNQNFLLSVLFLKFSKNLIIEKGLEGEEKNKESLDKLIEDNVNKIKIHIDEKREMFMKKEEWLLEAMQKIKKIFTDIERNNNNIINNTNTNNEINSCESSNLENFYLISCTWCNKALAFIEEFTNKYSMRSTTELFDINKFITKFIIFENESRKINNTFGIYPGPINNFGLLKGKDFWALNDIENSNKAFSYTNNIFVSKNLKENLDFYLLTKEQWEIVNNIFGNVFEIERIGIPKKLDFEIYLREVRILLINDKIKVNNIDLLKPRTILISKFETVGDLKNKIIDAYRNILFNKIKNNNKNNTIEKKGSFKEEKFDVGKMKLFQAFNYNCKWKRSLIKLIYMYKLNGKRFRIPGKLIEEDDIKMQDFDFNEKNDILIADLNSEFIQLDEYINEQTKEISCIICKKLVAKDKIVFCQFCKNFQYCSETCSKDDEAHYNYHFLIKKYTFPKLKLLELFKLNLEEIITQKNSCFGRVGLKNLGNTCFMNSAIQCLSHCEDLTKYFLLKHHLKDINSHNKYGSSGQVASAYFELILNLWNGNLPYLSPGDFRQILVKIIKKFQGFSQQDSHELLTYLLDTLHEDLNRVTDKPYIEMKEKFDSESDSEGSKRWWENHLKRENSIIVDLFHGQYKSTIRCPECQRISITYDPFMYLGLPISSNKNKIFVKYFPNFFKDLKHEYLNIEIPVNSNNFGFFTVKDLKLEIHSKYGLKKNNKLIIQYPTLLLCYEAVLLDKDKTFKKVLKDETEIAPLIENGEEVVLYEKFYDLEQIKYKNDYKTLFFNPVFLNQQTSMFIFTKFTKINLYYPMLITIGKNLLLFDLYYFIFLIYRKVIPECEKEIDFDLTKGNINKNAEKNENINNEKGNIYKKENNCKEIDIKNNENDDNFNKYNEENKNTSGISLEESRNKNLKEEEIFISKNNNNKNDENENFKKNQTSKKIKFRTNCKKFMEIFLSKQEDESYLIQEFKTYFSLNENLEFNSEEIPFELYFLNTIPKPTGFSIPLFNQKSACEFCGLKNCEFCPVSSTLNMNQNLSLIFEKIKVSRDLCFLIKFKNVLNTKLFNKDDFPLDLSDDLNPSISNNNKNTNKNKDFDNNNNNKIIKKSSLNNNPNYSKNVNIYDCLNLFNKEEKLEKDNTWYCSYCKKHQEATKRMEIYKAPQILIVQLKRFKLKSQNTFTDGLINGKNETLVEYPLEGLDLRKYIVGENSENAVYDLFAISQHFGNLSSGHYTSLCKNKGKWIEFDDETINEADDKNVVNSFAYLLFYKKRIVN